MMSREKIMRWLKDVVASPYAEWVFNVVFASMPIWLGAIILWANGEVSGRPRDWSDALLATMARGELLVFSATFLAPAFWMVSLDRDDARHFPLRTLWIGSLLVLWVVASSTFGVWRSAGYSGSNYSGIVCFSIALAVVAILLRLFVILANFHRVGGLNEGTYNEDTNEFVENYAKARGAND